MHTPGAALPAWFSPPAGVTITDRSCATYAGCDGLGRPPAVTSDSHSVGSAMSCVLKSAGTGGTAVGLHTLVHAVAMPGAAIDV